MTKILTRKPRIRLEGYDYSQENHYYITTCTENKGDWFGEIKNNEIILNLYGQICLKHLQNLPNHYKHIEIDTFVIMPNHLHAIIVINQTDKLLDNRNGQALGLSLHKNKTLSKILCDFKSFTSREINKTIKEGNKFRWQRSFYDHIIRNDRSLHRIRKYIIDNPANWDTDENNINNHKLMVQAGLNPT